MSIDRMIVKVAGAAWRIIGVSARTREQPSSEITIDVLAQVPGGSYESIFSTAPTIVSSAYTASGGVLRGDRRILPIGTLVRLGDTDNNIDTTVELHHRTRAVSQ